MSYSIVHKDEHGLFYWLRNTYESAPKAAVVAVFKGELYSVLEDKAEKFMRDNRGKPLESLTPTQIAELV